MAMSATNTSVLTRSYRPVITYLYVFVFVVCKCAREGRSGRRLLKTPFKFKP